MKSFVLKLVAQTIVLFGLIAAALTDHIYFPLERPWSGLDFSVQVLKNK